MESVVAMDYPLNFRFYLGITQREKPAERNLWTEFAGALAG